VFLGRRQVVEGGVPLRAYAASADGRKYLLAAALAFLALSFLAFALLTDVAPSLRLVTLLLALTTAFGQIPRTLGGAQ